MEADQTQAESLFGMPEEARGSILFVDDGNGKYAWCKIVRHQMACGRKLKRYLVGRTTTSGKTMYRVLISPENAARMIAEFVAK